MSILRKQEQVRSKSDRDDLRKRALAMLKRLDEEDLEEHDKSDEGLESESEGGESETEDGAYGDDFVMKELKEFDKEVAPKRSRGEMAREEKRPPMKKNRSDGNILLPVHQKVPAPRLTTSSLTAVLAFEKDYVRYERKIEDLAMQGYSASPMPVRSCVEPHVLQYICEYELGRSEDDWKTMAETELREHLFGKADALNQHEKARLAKKVSTELKMECNGGSTEDAAIKLFENLMKLLGDHGLRAVLNEKRKCTLIREALRPSAFASSVEDLRVTLPEWQNASKDVKLLRRLVLQQAVEWDKVRRAQKPPQTRFAQRGGAARLAERGRGGRGRRFGGGFGRGGGPPLSGANNVYAVRGRGGWRGRGVRGGYHRGWHQQRGGAAAQGYGRGRGHYAPRGGGRGGRGGLAPDYSDRRCYECNERGHIANNCPTKTAAEKPGKGVRRYRNNSMSAVVGGKLQVLYVPDTGADMTVLPAAMFERAKAQGAAMRVVEYEPHKEVYLADGGLVTIEKKVVADLTLSTLAGPTVLRGVHMDIMPGPGEELLLGQPEWSSLGLPSAAELIAESVEQNAEANTARGRSVRRVRAMAVFADEYPQFVDAHEEELKNVLPVPVNDKAKGAKLLDEAMEAMLARAEAEGAPVEFLTGMKKLLTEKGGRVFRLDISGEEPPANLEPFDIEFMDGAPLPRQPAARRYSPEHKAAMDEQVAALLAAGLIREGTGGAIVSPTHMVRKPNGTDWRMTIDYRAINRITVPRPFPIPLLESEYMQTQGAKVFASLDFPKGFWQILNTKRAAKRSAFATHNGVYEPERMQMGNRNAAQHFQCEVTKLLRQHNLLGKSVQSFIDDLLLYAKSWQDLLEVWSRVLDALIQAGLFVTPLKTNLWCKEVVWCGNMLSAEGVEVDPARLNALAQIQEPQNAGELMQFLAAVNFIRGKIPRYAQHVAPLQDILQKALQTCKRRTKAQAAGVQLSAVGWGEESKAAFKGLKVAISSAVKLTLPDASCEFCLMTDASEDHWGAVLTQVNAEEFVSDVCVEDMQHQPLAFLSGTFRGSQKMWSIVDKEAFAIKQSFERLEHLLHREKGVNVYTDHRNLLYIFSPAGRPTTTTKATAGRLDRWGMLLSEFKYIIRHVSGEKNVWADLLSRWGSVPLPNTSVKRIHIRIPDTRAVVEDTAFDEPIQEAEWPTATAIASAQKTAIAALREGSVSDTCMVKGTEISCVEGELWKTAEGAVWIPDDDTLKLRLMVIAHGGGAGHRGRAVTLQALQERFWWAELEEDVSVFIRKCLQCVKVVGGVKVPRPMGEQLIPTGPGQVIHFDYIHLGKGENGMVYVLVMMDAFLGKVELTPTASATAEVCAEALLWWFARYGVAKVWVSDQGTHFKNSLVDAVRRALKAEHTFTTPYASWANGSVERMNRAFLRLLRALLSENRMRYEEWPVLLQAVQFIINNTPSERRGGHSPMELSTGVKQQHPLDEVLQRPVLQKKAVDEIKLPAEIATAHLNALRETLDKLHKGAATAGALKRKANRKAAEKRGVKMHAGFSVGDFVLMARQQPNKLGVRWAGPMELTRVLSNWTFEVRDLVTGRKFIRHAQMLKRYSDQHIGITEDLRLQLAHDDSVNYDVDEILAWRKQRGKQLELQVRWMGFDEESDSWQAFAQMAEDVPQLVREFCDSVEEDARGKKLLLQAAVRAGL